MPADHTEFVIRPNSAFHPRTWVGLFALLALISLGIAARFALLGYWMILPFALLDVFAVGTLLWLVTRRCGYVERIVFSPEKMEIFHLQANADRCWDFPRYWSRVRLEPPRHAWYPHRLLLGCKGEWVEIGQCLTAPEKAELAAALGRELDAGGVRV